MRGLLLDNLIYKLVALTLTLVFFVMVRMDTTEQFSHRIPVMMENMPDDRVLTHDLPSYLTVHLSGSWSKIMRAVQPGGRPYVIDMQNTFDGEVVFFEEEKIRELLGPRPPAISSFEPASVTVRMEPKIRKSLRVRPDIVGEPARGFILKRDSVRVEPEEVSVYGPLSNLRDLTEVLTEPLDISGLENDFVRNDVRLNIGVPRSVSVDGERVRVEIPLEEVLTSTIFPNVPVEARGCRVGRICNVRPSRVGAHLTGPLRQIERIKASGGAQLLWIDAGAASDQDGSYEDVEIMIDAPYGVLVAPTPSTVTLEVTVLKPTTPFAPIETSPSESAAREGDGHQEHEPEGRN